MGRAEMAASKMVVLYPEGTGAGKGKRHEPRGGS